MDYYGRSRSPAPPSARRTAPGPRFSLQPDRQINTSIRHSQTEAELGAGIQPLDVRDFPPRMQSLKPMPRLSTSTQHLRVDSFNKVIMQRRSMSQLAVDAGPPPGPPPTCALPPLPTPLGER